MSLRVATAMGKDSCLYYLNHRLMQIFTDDYAYFLDTLVTKKDLKF